MQLKLSLIIIIQLLSLTKGFEDNSDVNRMSLYLKEGDIFKVDMRKIMSFYSTSVDFASNNKKVSLPGISSEPLKHILPEMTLTPVIFKNTEGHLFFVNEDRSKIHFYRLSKSLEPESIPFPFNDDLEKNPDLRIADFNVNKKTINILFYDQKDQQNPEKVKRMSKYSIFTLNYLELKTPSTATFEIFWCQKPTLKKLTPNVKEDESLVKVFLVFNKEFNTEKNFGVKKSFFLIRLNQAIETYIVPAEDVRQIHFNDILFNNMNIEIQVKNIMLSSTLDHRVFVFFQKKEHENTKNNLVFSCNIESNEDVQKIVFKNCKDFLSIFVKEFFLKATQYLYIDTTNQMHFANMKNDYHKTGQIQEDWDPKSILMEQNYAVIIMHVNNSKFVFVNDFTENTLTWYYDNKTPVLTSFIVFAFRDNKEHVLLAEIQANGEKGATLKDITLNPYLTIDARDLVQNQPINLYLEDKLILSYDLHLKTDRKVEEIEKDLTNQVLLVQPTNVYRTKLPFAGSDLHFTFDRGNDKIKHFNKIPVEINVNPELANQYYYMFKNWAFFEKSIVKLDCISDKQHPSYKCRQIEEIKLQKPIQPKLIQSIEQMGEILVLTAEKSDDFIFFDTFEKQIIIFVANEKFKSGKNCMTFNIFIACIYQIKPSIPQIKIQETIRIFVVEHFGLRELPSFEETLKKSVEEYQTKEYQSLGIEELKIVAFDFDSVQTHKLSVLYGLVYGENFIHKYMNYDFHYFPNQNSDKVLKFIGHNYQLENNNDIKKDSMMLILDSQTVFYNFFPTLKMFCQDEDSLYRFDFPETRKVLKTLELSSHSIIIFIYQDPQEKYFFIAYRITQNVVKQLIRNEEIPLYSESYILSVFAIDENTIIFYQYDSMGKVSYNSYMYFLNGPFLVHNELDVLIQINGEAYPLRFHNDKAFDLNLNKMIDNNRITIDESKKGLSLPINKYFSFEGNMVDIQLTKKSQNIKGVSLKKPLTLIDNFELISITKEEEFLEPKVITSEFWFVVQKDVKKPNYVLVKRENIKTQVKVTFKIQTGKICDQILISDLSILCFWSDGVYSEVTIQSVSSDINPQITIKLPEFMIDPKVILDNNASLILIYRDIYSKYICLMIYDRNSKTEKSLYIGKNEMGVDDLRILDFFYEYNRKSRKLTVIFIDGHSNQLLIYHGGLDDKHKIPILKRSIDLNEIDLSIEKLNCISSLNQNYLFSCFLFSPSHIYHARILQNEVAQISPFKWEMKIYKKFYNILCGTAPENILNVDSLIDKNNLFIFEKDINNANKKQIVQYDIRLKNNKYSSFAFDLTDYKKILSIDYNSENEINVFYLLEGSIFCLRLKIGVYSIEIFDQMYLDKQEIQFNAVFLQNEHPSSFFFSIKAEVPENLLENKNVWFALLITGNVIFAVLILLAIVYLLVLIRERKKLLMATGQQVDETEIDISYM